MTLYRSHGRGSFVVERTLLGVAIRRRTGCFDREMAVDLERVLVKLAENGRRDVLVAFAEGKIRGPELRANVERYGVSLQLVLGEAAKDRVCRSSRPARPHWVYIVQRVDTGHIKVGVSNDVWRRVSQIEGSGGARVRVLVAFPGGHKEEREIHDQFAAYRTIGEWFLPDPGLLDFIAVQRELPEAWGLINAPGCTP